MLKTPGGMSKPPSKMSQKTRHKYLVHMRVRYQRSAPRCWLNSVK